MDNIDLLKMKDAVNKSHTEMAEKYGAKAEYRAELEASLFETRDLLREMKESSDRESRYNRRMNAAILIVALLTLAATIVSLFR